MNETARWFFYLDVRLALVAVGVSYATHHDWLWALLHGVLSWVYLGYWGAQRWLT